MKGGKEIENYRLKVLNAELRSWQSSYKKVNRELAEYRRNDFPGRIKTNGIIEKEEFEMKCLTNIDRLQNSILFEQRQSKNQPTK